MSTAVPFCESIGIDVPAHLDAAEREVRDRHAVPGRSSTSARSAGCSRTARSRGTQVLERWRRARPGERGVRRDAPAQAGSSWRAGSLTRDGDRSRGPRMPSPRSSTPSTRSASSTWASSAASRSRIGPHGSTISYCSLGCPCIELIEDDIAERLLELDGIERVEIVRGLRALDAAPNISRTRSGAQLRAQVGVGDERAERRARGRCSRGRTPTSRFGTSDGWTRRRSTTPIVFALDAVRGVEVERTCSSCRAGVTRW